MKVLVIVGYCLNVNSSANLCHISYIKGLVDNGYSVDLLSANASNCIIDNSIKIPDVNNYFFYSTSLYELLNKKKNNGSNKEEPDLNLSKNTENNKSIYISKILNYISRSLRFIKNCVRKLYGKYGTDISWYRKAKKFKSSEKYDYVISISFPPTSHLLANYLKRSKRVQCDNWIQIWEDPWSADLFNLNNAKNQIIRKEENKLLNNANDIVYVSPITLEYQKQLFPDNAKKMRWAPLPTYYQSKSENIDFSELHFGYFGDYNINVRNLVPMYNCAIIENLNMTICGNTDLTLTSSSSINIYPRLSLSELSVHEDKANVLVFLCNLRGGQIPGKIYQYSASNKFILFILDGTDEEKSILKDYFSKFNRYVFCDNNESSIKNAIDHIKSNTDKTELYTPINDFEPKKIINYILGS